MTDDSRKDAPAAPPESPEALAGGAQPAPDEDFDDEEGGRDEDGNDSQAEDRAFNSGDFHNVVQKQVAHAVFETLVDTKMHWSLVAPFLDAAREMCAADLDEGGRIRLHTLVADGEAWVDAEEAFLGIEIVDRDTGAPWLSQTYWISDIATATDDPAEVRAIAAGLERSVAKLNAWLAERERKEPGDAD
jgi:hypothetical protein